ncbi:hypothetical protein BsWGS_14354 [Bradybaena similaris]
MAASSTTLAAVGEASVVTSTGTGETSQNGPRRWERPWTVQEIHAEAGHWSLAGDSGLLQHLQEFSQRVISRTHQIGKEVDDLVHETKLMDVRVGNVINDFIMLANTQFVENRVYDEDVSQEPSSKEEKKMEQEKTKEQREAELIPRVSLALKLGVDVIENSFVKLDPRVVDSDSEEDEMSDYVSDPILEAKDPYVNRPLPFLIGTPQFMEDDNVGLLDESSEEEEGSDQGSISVSEDDKEGNESDSEYSASEESEEEDRRKVAHRKHRAPTKTAGSESSDSDSGKEIFSTKKSGSEKSAGDDSGDVSDSEDESKDVQEKSAALPRGPKDFNAELAARLGTAAPRESADREESGQQWKDRSANYRSQHSLSSGVHPNVGNKGMKTRDTKEVAADKVKDNVKHSKSIVKDDDLFAQDNRQDDDDDIFNKDRGLFSSSKGLFDDDDEDADNEGGLFADVKKPSLTVQKSKEKPDSLFSDSITNEEIEDSKMSGDQLRTKSSRPVPTGAVSVSGKGEDLTPVPKLESSGTHTIKKPTAQPAVASKPTGLRTPLGGGGGGGLFDDSEEEDDLFSGASKHMETTGRKENVNTPSKATVKKIDLFDDDDDGDDDLFGTMAAAATKKKNPGNVGITVESYDEGETVKEQKLKDEQLRKQATPEKKLPPGAVSMFGKNPNPLVAALKNQQQTASSEEEENDWSEEGRNSLTSSIHSTSSTTLPPAQKSADGTRNMGSGSSPASSIFTDDRGDDDDLFSNKPKSDSKPITDSQVSTKLPELDHKQTPSKVKSVKDSLFDSSAEDEDVDIFSPVARSTASTKADKGVSLFGDTEPIGASKTGTNPGSRLASQPANSKTGSLLFDDSQEEGAEPLFPAKLSDTAGGKDTVKNKTQGLFVQDDLLFGSGADEDPFVDLFSSKASLTEPSLKKETLKTTSQTPTASGKPAAGSLFEGGDDGDNEDGLFFVTPVTKAATASPPAPVATSVSAPVMKTISGVTETESADAAEVKVTEKPEVVKEIKKPAGAVSMFGGVDPASVLKRQLSHPSHEDNSNKDVKRNDKEVKNDGKKALTEEKATAKTQVLRPKPSTDLFGGDDDDDDDLFSPTTTVKTAVKGDALGEPADVSAKEGTATPKAEPMKPRKPAGAVPMFGGVDPSAFVKKEPVVEAAAEATDEGRDKEKPSPPRPAPKPKVMPREKQDENLKIKSQNGTAVAAAGLFGDDGDDSDDLFGVTKQKSPPQVAPKSTALASHSSVAASNDSQKSEREPQSPTVRSKLLAGAVPMFGGIDPFAAMKKKSLSSEPEEESSSQKEKPPIFVDPLAVLVSSASLTAAPKHPAAPVIIAKRSVDITAAINSTYVLPNETRSDQDTDLEKSGSLDFEESTETEMLSSASKDRPKLSRRRPQSRKARVLAAAQTGINFGDAPPITLPDAAPITFPDAVVFKVPDIPEKPHPGTRGSSHESTPGPQHVNHLSDSNKFTANPKSADLFGNDDLLDGLPIATDRPLVADMRKTASDEIFSKDLLHGRSKISNGAAEDLFSDFKKQEDIPPARSETRTTDKTTANEVDEIDGLFSKPSGKTKTDALSAFLSNNGDLHHTSPLITTRPKTRVDEDVDDLFTPSSKGSAPKPSLASLRGDDLFSKSSSSLSRGSSVADSKSSDIFGDIDDAFGASSLGRQKDTSSNPKRDGVTGTQKLEDAKNVRPKQPVAKEANLLKDETDIFSDIPKSTPKGPKKKTSKKIVEKNVFKDDIDDIFANTTAATIKPKKDVRKKVAKPAAVISDNIFDDPLS